MVGIGVLVSKSVATLTPVLTPALRREARRPIWMKALMGYCYYCCCCCSGVLLVRFLILCGCLF